MYRLVYETKFMNYKMALLNIKRQWLKKVENTRRRQQYDNPITKEKFDDAVHYCNNLTHNNNTEKRFVSSGANVLMSNSAYYQECIN